MIAIRPVQSPSVSVIVRVYNGLPFLQGAIESILDQSLHDFELLIVDNGSTDGSLEYARSISDHRVRVITEERRGPAAATNAGLAHCRAELVAVVDADDIVPPQRLETQVEFMRANPEIVLVGTRFAFLVGSHVIPVPPQPREHAEIRRALLQGLPVIHNGSSMFRARVAKLIGGHRIEGPGHDLDFFLRMSEVGRVSNLPDLLLYYRLHDREVSCSSNPKLIRSQSFAVACARARMGGFPEPDEETFNRGWNKRPLPKRFSEFARRISLRMYKQAIIKRARREHLSSAVSLVCSAALSPEKVIWRVKRNLGRC
jgi:glycosyltransferase involved in cell wall biosynthesis